jgi:hypothetical protein
MRRCLTRHLPLAVFLGLVGSLLIGLAASAAVGRVATQSPITVSKVEKAFRPWPEFLHGIAVLRNLKTPLPHGDLGEYSFYAAKSPKAYQAQRFPIEVPANLTVFPTVTGARRASLLILHGGACVAHSDALFTEWKSCNHLRVANVLLIMSSTLSTGYRRTLETALNQLGRPTTS